MNEKEKTLAALNSLCKNTLNETLHITYTDFGEDYLVAKMPVNSSVFQPDGILNGGATMALAESVGSPASMLAVDNDKFMVRGISFSANHLRSVKSGNVTATAKFIHKGRTTHLIEINVEDDQGKLISNCRLTNIILPKK
ncbi:PaaI family thioesterase [Lutibacter sp.]|uniref:PaaI family thioesterase n=1 Tax=Lutibacter sp. TaxID=1925666 RepID=UPI003569FC20